MGRGCILTSLAETVTDTKETCPPPSAHPWQLAEAGGVGDGGQSEDKARPLELKALTSRDTSFRIPLFPALHGWVCARQYRYETAEPPSAQPLSDVGHRASR